MRFQPIIPWIGGKRRLAKHIIPFIPKHTCYVEPFAGAAAILFLKAPSKVEVINDINLDLITLYRVVQNHLEEFIRQFKWVLTSRQQYDWFQETPSFLPIHHIGRLKAMELILALSNTRTLPTL